MTATDTRSFEPGWQHTPGLITHGPVTGSGLTSTTYLVERGDGQMVHLSELLYLVLERAAPGRTSAEVADEVSRATGRVLTPHALDTLARTKLEPLGLLRDAHQAGAQPGPAPRADPLLGLRLRGTLVPARAVQAVSPHLVFTFWPPLMVAVAVAVATLDVLLLRRGDPWTALNHVLATPALLLTLFAILTVGAVIHELGHAVGCRAGGGRPGRIGVGVYLLFPAFYTDVTQSYRLSRSGRLRTDLGGLYFNLWCLLGLALGYLFGGEYPVLLLALLLMHLEMAQQLVPTVRFDGYYVLSDLAGVPDLFARVRPLLTSLLPGASVDPRVRELRPGPRRIVTAWVLLVVPTLLVGFGWLLWNLPTIVATTLRAITQQAHVLTRSWSAGQPAQAVLAVLALALLAVPLLGLAAFAVRPLRAPFRWARAQLQATTLDPASPVDAVPSGAAAFTDDLMLPDDQPAATRGWRHLVHRVTHGHISLPPGAAERRTIELVERARTPLVGTRHIVVMSRKGGVGKTTITLTLGATLARLRGDRVVAVDANPDAGNLAHRATRPPTRAATVAGVLSAADTITSYADMRARTCQTVESSLEVLATDDDPTVTTALDRHDYQHLTELLDRYYNIVLFDTGTGILHSANQGLLNDADQLVLVLRPALDGGRAAALTLDWLDAHGHTALVRNAIVVINATRTHVGIPLAPLQATFSARCRCVLRIPWDPALEAGARTRLDQLRTQTRNHLAELAAAVADGFPSHGATTPGPPADGPDDHPRPGRS